MLRLGRGREPVEGWCRLGCSQDPCRLEPDPALFYSAPSGAPLLASVVGQLRDGPGGLFAVLGEAGAGKSMLLRVLQARLAEAGIPETYHYSWGDGRAALVARMRQSMTEALAALWSKRPRDYPLASPEEALALASIVEKETGVAAERPRIAGVFLNRLKRGMKLQSDPTVVYGLTQGAGPLGRELTRADLQAPHGWNTYVHGGLPPGPIANPGRAALEATLTPAATSELYFVADGSGGHAFAETLEEHNRNVRRWRKLRDDEGREN